LQFLAAAIAVLPLAGTEQGMPAAPHGPGALLATAGLAVGGTLLPFALSAYGQSRVSAEVAGAFLNLEPLVGAIAGAVVFGDPAGLAQVAGGMAILAGIALSSLPLIAAGRMARRAAAVAGAEAVGAGAGAGAAPGRQGDGRPGLARAGRAPRRDRSPGPERTRPGGRAVRRPPTRSRGPRRGRPSAMASYVGPVLQPRAVVAGLSPGRGRVPRAP